MPHHYFVTFLDAKRAAGLSDRTVEWYAYTLGTYVVYCNESRLQYEKPDTITAFLAYLRMSKYAAATVSGFCTALAAWFNWLVKRRLFDESPMRYVDRPRKVRKRKPHMTQAQFMHLYHSIGDEVWRDYRDRAMLLLMFYSGLRRNELLDLTCADSIATIVWSPSSTARAATIARCPVILISWKTLRSIWACDHATPSRGYGSVMTAVVVCAAGSVVMVCV